MEGELHKQLHSVSPSQYVEFMPLTSCVTMKLWGVCKASKLHLILNHYVLQVNVYTANKNAEHSIRPNYIISLKIFSFAFKFYLKF